MTNTAYDKAYNALVLKGEELTASQLASRCGVSNPGDLVYRLRQNGYAIYLNEKTNSKGETVQKYRAGKPSRELVAAGYRALAAGF